MFYVTISMKNIVVHDSLDIGGLAKVYGNMELTGLLGEVHGGLDIGVARSKPCFAPAF